MPKGSKRPKPRKTTTAVPSGAQVFLSSRMRNSGVARLTIAKKISDAFADRAGKGKISNAVAGKSSAATFFDMLDAKNRKKRK